MSKWQSADEGDSALTEFIAPFGTIAIIIVLRLDTQASDMQTESSRLCVLGKKDSEIIGSVLVFTCWQIAYI